MSKQTRIRLVRHGQVHNPMKVVYGRMPRFRLSDEGIVQARASARFFRGTPVASLFSSPLLRARQTAAEIKKATNRRKIRISRLINEVNSPFEGRPSAAADARGGDVYTGAASKFEQPEDIVNRTKKFFRRSANRHPGRDIVAVTHGDVIMFTMLWSLGHALDPRLKGQLDSLGITGGYPAHGSITTFSLTANWASAKPAVSYWAAI